MSDRKYETLGERKTRMGVECATATTKEEEQKYCAPNGTVPKKSYTPAKTKSLGDAVTAVKGLFSSGTKKKK